MGESGRQLAELVGDRALNATQRAVGEHHACGISGSSPARRVYTEEGAGVRELAYLQVWRVDPQQWREPLL